VVLAILALVTVRVESSFTESVRSEPGVPEAARDDAAKVLDLHRAGRSDEVVQLRGRVERVLPDDLQGSRHQRFVLRLSNDHTVLVAHNIDLAERVPLEAKDQLELQGEYEWNEKGGVVHWTHHDPRGRHEGGWIRHAGVTYE